MSISKVSVALQYINQALQSRYVTIETPISLNQYTIKPLQGKSEQELRNAILKRKDFNIISNLYKIIYEHIVNNKNIDDNTYLDFETFIKTNTGYDIREILKGLLIATYEYVKDYEIICPHCETLNKFDKLYYNKFERTSKTWDKNVSFDKYEIIYEDKLADVNIEAVMKIPTLYHELNINKTVLNDTDITNKDVTELIPTLSTSNIERALYVIDKFIIKTDNSDNSAQEIVLDNVYDIKIILEKLPENIIQNIIETYNKELSDYIPVYMQKVKCKNCEKEIEIPLEPIIEFITRILL